MDLCGQCGGVYLDEGEFDRLIAERFVGKKMESMFAFVANEVADAIGCPSCAEAMRRTEFDEIEIDVCECGGIWLDGHERQQFAVRAAGFGREPEPEATVECSGCGAVEPQRLCIRRMDAFWCEACVIVGNHPGKEAQLVGTKDYIAGAARSFAVAKADQGERKARAETRKSMAKGMRSMRGRNVTGDPLTAAFAETIVRKISNLFGRGRR